MADYYEVENNRFCKIIIVIISLMYIFFRTTDDNNVDSFDKYFNLVQEGGSRNSFGVIYDNNGKIDLWKNVLDVNPYWN